MSGVRRFAFEVRWGCIERDEFEEGRYVEYSDYAKLEEEVKALRADAERAVEGLKAVVPAKEVDEVSIDDIARVLHYPEHWDTVTYPTLFDAVYEIGCSECGQARAKIGGNDA